MNEKYLFMLLGHPGSGKTYFSERLAGEIGVVRINADAMRVSMLGTVEAAREFDTKTGLLNTMVFGSLDYVTHQILSSGKSVICDYQHNEKSTRDKRVDIASRNNAQAIVVWVQASRDEAIKRGAEREVRLDQRKHSTEKMEALVDKYVGLLEAPGSDEKVIVINGTATFTDQFASFTSQLKKL